MADDKEKEIASELVSLNDTSTSLSMESLDIINKVIAENDIEKTKDLTQLFNLNQTKKELIRLNKKGELLDLIINQAINRFSARADEITTKELLDGIKTVQDSIERGQKQVNGTGDAPLIQFNQQNNEVNVGQVEQLDRTSRERVKNAVLSLIGNLTNNEEQKEKEDKLKDDN